MECMKKFDPNNFTIDKAINIMREKYKKKKKKEKQTKDDIDEAMKAGKKMKAKRSKNVDKYGNPVKKSEGPIKIKI